jgi:hypothetical protein
VGRLRECLRSRFEAHSTGPNTLTGQAKRQTEERIHSCLCLGLGLQWVRHYAVARKDWRRSVHITASLELHASAWASALA